MLARVFVLAVLSLATAAVSACGGGGGEGDETIVVPTLPPGFEATQSAFSTSEAATFGPLPTSTRVAPPEDLPTRASGTLVVAASDEVMKTQLFDVLEPMFESESGYDVQIATRTSADGRAMASAGQADAALLSPPETLQAIADGLAEGEPTAVLRIDYVLLGPPDDPAAAGQQERMDDAFRAIAAAQGPFVSWSDDSDTHRLELTLWPGGSAPVDAAWYGNGEPGQGDTLETASASGAYALSDRWEFVSRRDAMPLEVLVDGDPGTIVTYSVVVVDPATRPNVNATAARAFAAFLSRADVRQIIEEYGAAAYGEAVFVAP